MNSGHDWRPVASRGLLTEPILRYVVSLPPPAEPRLVQTQPATPAAASPIRPRVRIFRPGLPAGASPSTIRRQASNSSREGVGLDVAGVAFAGTGRLDGRAWAAVSLVVDWIQRVRNAKASEPHPGHS